MLDVRTFSSCVHRLLPMAMLTSYINKHQEPFLRRTGWKQVVCTWAPLEATQSNCICWTTSI